jgi:hypothetical protein
MAANIFKMICGDAPLEGARAATVIAALHPSYVASSFAPHSTTSPQNA